MAEAKASMQIEIDTSQAEEALERIESSLDRIIAKLAAIKSLKESGK